MYIIVLKNIHIHVHVLIQIIFIFICSKLQLFNPKFWTKDMLKTLCNEAQIQEVWDIKKPHKLKFINFIK